MSKYPFPIPSLRFKSAKEESEGLTRDEFNELNFPTYCVYAASRLVGQLDYLGDDEWEIRLSQVGGIRATNDDDAKAYFIDRFTEWFAGFWIEEEDDDKEDDDDVDNEIEVDES